MYENYVTIANRFKEEWELFKKENEYSSADQILEICIKKKKYSSSDISNFKSTKKKLQEEDIEIFSDLFGIRKEYLAGLDHYRTTKDKEIAVIKEKSLYMAFHHLLTVLGYADLETDASDYNFSFPSNTMVFLESLKDPSLNEGVSIKDELQKENVSLILDVNKDKFIAMHDDVYKQIISEVTDFIEYKLSKIFVDSMSVPDVITDNATILRHPKTSLPLKDGMILDFEIKYTPTGELSDDTFNQTFQITERKSTR